MLPKIVTFQNGDFRVIQFAQVRGDNYYLIDLTRVHTCTQWLIY